MSEIATLLRTVLERTGYLSNGVPAAPSVGLAGTDNHLRLPSFAPDAWWRSSTETNPWTGTSDLKVYFKFVEEPEAVPVVEWHQEVWNQGYCPLLWLVSPERIELYNGFGRPRPPAEWRANRLRPFGLAEAELARLDAFAGRLAMETGGFWHQAPEVNRRTSVDGQLLRDLHHLERRLVDEGLSRDETQRLIGRSIFAQYLIDREIVDGSRLQRICGHEDLPGMLSDRPASKRLFDWLRETFNGDLFPLSSEAVPDPRHLDLVREFLMGTDMETGQRSLFFPYRFDVIPVELISAIYEQFVHSAANDSSGRSRADAARRKDVHYTPLTAVSLVMDEICEGLTGNEIVLDLTCGSGVFLVEALRRLVHLKSGDVVPTRSAIRKTLYEQIHGVDISPEAARIAAFSLYLAALELDPHPHRLDGLRFDPLVDHTILVSDAFDVDFGTRKFDIIVGNPPWSYRGRAGTGVRRVRSPDALRSPRGESLDFVARAMQFAHERTRFGVILSATPFFSRSATGLAAAQRLVESLGPVTLLNLADLSKWLFRRADMPAILLLARLSEQRADRMTLAQARWSPAGERSHAIETALDNVTTLPLASWKRNAGLFKAAFVGHHHDLLLLDDLWDKQLPLERGLAILGTGMHTGLKFGNRSRDATFLDGLPFAGPGAVRHFTMGDDLPAFNHVRAERPRKPTVYRAPIVLIKEFMLQGNPRPVVAVTEEDTVFSDAYFGVSFADSQAETAYLLAGILGSALASWFFLMTGAAFGLWLRRVQCADILALPAPDLEQSLESEIGKHVVELARAFHGRTSEERDWKSLDEAVFDLYGLDDEDRLVVRDGLFRASWQWQEGRLRSVAPANLPDLQAYARAFLATMDAWLGASNRRRMRAEIYRLPDDAPLRLIRFVLEETPGPSRDVHVITPEGTLSTVLAGIGARTGVRITEELVGLRDLRVHAADEVSIIKPAARRNWLRVQALEDADGVVSASVRADRAP
ncbi:MAG: N-6 DNA methylase [Spirochaetaceae bacterium]|nr:N-6 DNA methylase [Spirochaetaceae bacterium]